MKRYLREYPVLLFIGAFLATIDQITKEWVRQNLVLGEIYRPELWLSQYIRIVHWKNTGAAFGMFQDLSDVFTILSFIVCGVILYYFPQIPRQDWLIRLAMGMMFGGAIGNLIDRLTHGHVTDFISVGGFPVFNVADASISTGVVVLFFGMWFQEKRKKIEEDPAPSADSGAAPPPKPSSLSEEIQGE